MALLKPAMVITDSYGNFEMFGIGEATKINASYAPSGLMVSAYYCKSGRRVSYRHHHLLEELHRLGVEHAAEANKGLKKYCGWVIRRSQKPNEYRWNACSDGGMLVIADTLKELKSEIDAAILKSIGVRHG